MTWRAVSIDTVHVVTRPAQSPDQPVNIEPEPEVGVAVNVTDAPVAKSAAQVAPQSMPGGPDDTTPDPVPTTETASG